jgi:hypothetical protein
MNGSPHHGTASGRKQASAVKSQRRQPPGSHRGASDRYARGMAHGAIVTALMFLLLFTFALGSFLL